MEMGQQAMKVLYKEPIKEAVKEALAEEGVISNRTAVQSKRDETDHVQSMLRSRQDKETDTADETGSSFPGSKTIIPAAMLLGAAIALKRLREGSLETDKLDEIMGMESTPSMEEDMSKSVPGGPDKPDFPDEEAGEVDV